MSRSALQTVHPTSHYDLQSVFQAVQSDKAGYEGQLEGAAEWAKHWPPAHMAAALGRVLNQLAEWRDQGVTVIVAEAPFSDGSLTGPVQNTIIQQFRDGRVQPAAAPARTMAPA